MHTIPRYSRLTNLLYRQGTPSQYQLHQIHIFLQYQQWNSQKLRDFRSSQQLELYIIVGIITNLYVPSEK
jgi:hypothetical protein